MKRATPLAEESSAKRQNSSQNASALGNRVLVDAGLDVGNIHHLHHVNIDVPDQMIAQIFYRDGLCLVRDPFRDGPSDTAWFNVGNEQLHLPLGKAQVFRGTIYLVHPDLKEVVRSLRELEKSKRLAKTEVLVELLPTFSPLVVNNVFFFSVF